MDEPLKLPADLGIENSTALHALLLAHVDDAAPVTLAAGEVTRLHAASLQVLAAFVRTRHTAGQATAWQDPSAELRAAANKLGLLQLLGLPN